MGENLPVKVFFPEKIRITQVRRHARFLLKYLGSVFFKQVRCGYGHLVALDEHGRAWSWGLNKNGQLGLGKTLPLTVQFLLVLTNLSLARGHGGTPRASAGASFCR